MTNLFIGKAKGAAEIGGVVAVNENDILLTGSC